MNSKRPLLILLSFLVVSLPVAAQAKAEVTRPTASGNNSEYCTRLSQKYETLSNKVTAAQTKVKTSRTQKETELTQDRVTADQELRAKQDAWDQDRTAQFDKLEELATTEEQKTAVTKFSEAVRVAVEVRRTAVKNALATYRTAVDQLRATNADQANQAYTLRQEAVKTAFDKAVADCTAGVARTEVKSQLFASLKQAETAYKTARKGIEKFNVSLEPLKAARKAAIDQANATFKASVETARNEMKSVLITPET